MQPSFEPPPQTFLICAPSTCQSHRIHRYLTDVWTADRPTIPQEWKNATLTLLAKRTVNSLTDLRPIALTCGIGKAVLGALVKCAHRHVAPTLAKYPLFAYTAKRGVLEALHFAFEHCHQVRASCVSAKPSHWQRQAGHVKPILVGGLMLSFDLSQASDRLPRSELFEGLMNSSCPESVALLFG